MTTEFEVIANKLLTARGKELNEQQQEKLGTILKPLNDKIKDFEEQVRKAYESEGKERHLLKSEVAKLVEQNQRLSKDADNLTKALKGDSQAQGAWGEMLLEKLLDSSGLDALQQLHRALTKRGVALVLAHVNEQPLALVRSSGFEAELGPENVVPTVGDAFGGLDDPAAHPDVGAPR